jgi:chromosome partitioning protein
LATYLEQTGFPVQTNLRNAQIYVQSAEQGASLFDMRPSLVARDLQEWAPLLHWLTNADRNAK